MITKAIVEQQIDNYRYRVRIPLFDRVEDAATYTDFEDLCVATLSSTKGISNSLNIGDVVFVGFEDNNASKPIILGHLYREVLTKENTAFIQVSNATITDTVNLPENTFIGNISYRQLLELVSTVSELKE